MRILRLGLFLSFILIFVSLGIASAEKIDKKLVRENLDDFASFAYAIDPTYNIDQSDLEIAQKNPNTKFALGIGLNSTFKVTSEDRLYLKKNPNTLFAYALAQNGNYKLSSEDIKYISSGDASTLYAFGLSRNPNCQNESKGNENSTSTKAKENRSSTYADGSRFLFTYNSKQWLISRGFVMPQSVQQVYSFITNLIMTPFDFLQNNFQLFDFLSTPISHWNGWAIIHALIVISFISGVFLPKPPIKTA